MVVTHIVVEVMVGGAGMELLIHVGIVVEGLGRLLYLFAGSAGSLAALILAWGVEKGLLLEEG